MEGAYPKKVKQGLGFKFILFVNSLFVVMVSILSIILLVGFKRSSEDQLRQRGLKLANNISAIYQSTLPAEDTTLLKPIVKEIAQESDMVYAMVLNNGGKGIVHSDEREIGKRLEDPLTEQAVKTTRENIFQFN
jgi:sensor histidine kinase regulating citrate/malate metabolism